MGDNKKKILILGIISATVVGIYYYFVRRRKQIESEEEADLFPIEIEQIENKQIEHEKKAENPQIQTIQIQSEILQALEESKQVVQTQIKEQIQEFKKGEESSTEVSEISKTPSQVLQQETALFIPQTYLERYNKMLALAKSELEKKNWSLDDRKR